MSEFENGIHEEFAPEEEPAAEGSSTESKGTREESKHDAFLRLSSARINKAAKAIQLIGNLSGPNYSYSMEEVEKLFGYLQQELDKAKSKFVPCKEEDDEGFTWG